MTINFSILKDIDFTSPDNLWFSLIISIVAIIVFLIFILIIARIIKVTKWIIKKIFMKTFNVEVKRPGQSVSQIHMQNLKNIGATSNVPEVKPQENSGGYAKPQKSSALVSVEDKVLQNRKDNMKDIEDNLSSLKSGGARTNLAEEKLSAPRRSLSGNYFAKKAEGNNSDSSIIFKGAQEVSRTELEQQMKSDANVWQAASGEGLSISPLERAKLVKDVLPSNLGSSISKEDLKVGVRRLGEKMSNAKTPEEHAKIRKEIKFFKKIGGIK